jgi:hypothetical protein
MILDGVIGPALEERRYLTPPLPISPDTQEQNPLLLLVPFGFDYAGSQVVEVPLSALLAGAVWDEG